MEQGTTNLAEVIADIALLAGHVGYYSGDSRADISQFIYWATEFEAIHAATDWHNTDYMETVEQYAMTKINASDFKNDSGIKTKKPVSDEQREKDVQALCGAIINRSASHWDNPNGAYESSCPYCGVTEHRGGGGEIWAEMSELQHKQNCAYLIAKDLSTGIK
jgi:hypothetical protein